MIEQLFANALIATSIYTLAGISFALLFRVARFFDLSFGLTYAVGAYTALVATRSFAWPFASATIVAMGAAAAAALLIDALFFAPLRRRRASGVVFFLASLGIYVVGQNLLSVTFGDAAQTIRPAMVAAGLDLLGARITLVQLAVVALSATATGLLAALLAFTRLGRQIRAVADDVELAIIAGVKVPHVIAVTIAVAAAMGGLAGVMTALDRDMIPTMGMNILLTAIVAAIVGGGYSISGVALAAALIATAQNIAVLWISSGWQDAIVFVILILFLLFRPQGFFGGTLRRSSV